MLLETADTGVPTCADRPARHALADWRQWLLAGTESCPENFGTRDRAANGARHETRPIVGRVLLISYEFPPTGGSGVQRPAKLAKYLPSLGWQVDVLAAGHDRFPWSDPSLLEDLGRRCRVHRVRGLEPACLARLIASPLNRVLASENVRWVEDRLYWRFGRITNAIGRGNGESLWLRPAVRAALRLHARRPFDAVISTGPPHFAHQVALRIRRESGPPWIADLRDPLVSDFSRASGREGSAQTQTMRWLERDILQHASIVVTTCPALAEDLRSRFPRRPPETIRAITNGFDGDDLRRALAGRNSCESGCERGFSHQLGVSSQLGATPQLGERFLHQQSSECVFVAAGSLYGRREIGRLVEPLSRVLDAHPDWHGRVRLVLAGSIDAQQRRRWEQGRPEWLTLAGYLDHASALRLAARAPCNIVMVPDCGHGRLSVPGKLFELLALPTHVLVLAPESGDTARIARAAGGVTIVPLEQAGRVAACMERVITDHFAGRLALGRDWAGIDVYHRRAIAAQFAERLESTRGGAR